MNIKKKYFRLLVYISVFVIIGAIYWVSKLSQAIKDETQNIIEIDTIRIGVTTWAGYLGGQYFNEGFDADTIKSRFYKEYGFCVEFVLDDNFETLQEKWINDEIHLLWTTVDAFPVQLSIDSLYWKYKPKVIFQSDWSRGGDVIVATKDIKSIPDLIGKHVAFTANSSSQTLLMWALNAASISYSMVNLWSMQDKFGPTKGFIAGYFSAAAVWSPEDEMCLNEVEGSRVLLSTRYASNVVADVFFAKKEYIRKNKEILAKLITGWFIGVSEILQKKEHEKKALKILHTGFNKFQRYEFTESKLQGFRTDSRIKLDTTIINKLAKLKGKEFNEVSELNDELSKILSYKELEKYNKAGISNKILRKWSRWKIDKKPFQIINSVANDTVKEKLKTIKYQDYFHKDSLVNAIIDIIGESDMAKINRKVLFRSSEYEITENQCQGMLDKVRLCTLGDNENFFNVKGSYQGITGGKIFSMMRNYYIDKLKTFEMLGVPVCPEWRDVSTFFLISKQKLPGIEHKGESEMTFMSPTNEDLNTLALSSAEVSVTFKYGSAYLSPKARATIDMIVEVAQIFKNLRIRIDGNTDSSEEINDTTLSKRRAESVRTYFMTEHDFDKNRFVIVGKYDKDSVMPNATEEGRAKNRRTVFKLLSPRNYEIISDIINEPIITYYLPNLHNYKLVKIELLDTNKEETIRKVLVPKNSHERGLYTVKFSPKKDKIPYGEYFCRIIAGLDTIKSRVIYRPQSHKETEIIWSTIFTPEILYYIPDTLNQKYIKVELYGIKRNADKMIKVLVDEKYHERGLHIVKFSPEKDSIPYGEYDCKIITEKDTIKSRLIYKQKNNHK